LLLVVGVRAANGLTPSKAWLGVLVTVLVVLSLQALVGGGLSSLNDLSVSRPFFF